MRIYFASIEPYNLTMGRNILLSYYDLTMSPLRFRKETWELLKVWERGIDNDRDKKETGSIGRKDRAGR